MKFDQLDIDIKDDTLKSLGEIGVPTLCGGMTHEQGYRNNYMMDIKPLAIRKGQVMVGRARTLRFIVLREDLVKAQYEQSTSRPHRDALETIQPGEVLVIDTGGCLEAAVLGDMFTRRVKARGGLGIVIDGVIRDLSAIREVGHPVFARGTHGAGIPRALMSVGLDEPIQCGGVPVIPGDIVVGDEDGVVVIPPSIAEDVAEEGSRHTLQEEWARPKLEAGASLHEVYPPTGKWLDEFNDWVKTRNSP